MRCFIAVLPRISTTTRENRSMAKEASKDVLILFYSRLCLSTAGSSPPPESSIFLCPLLSSSIPLLVADLVVVVINPRNTNKHSNKGLPVKSAVRHNSCTHQHKPKVNRRASDRFFSGGLRVLPQNHHLFLNNYENTFTMQNM